MRLVVRMTSSGAAEPAFLTKGAALSRPSAWGNMIAKSLSVPVEKACRLLLIAVAAPILGEAGFGRFQYADTVTAFLVLATELGLGMWTTRALARAPERAHEIVGTGLRVKCLAALPYLLLIAAAAAATGQVETQQALVILGIATLAGSLVEYCNAVFRGYERLRDEGRLNAVRAILVTSAALAGVCWRRSLLALAVGLMVGTVAAAGVGLTMLRRSYRLLAPMSWPRRDRGLARSAVTEALPLWIATLLSLVYFKGDTILLRFFGGDAAVGSYSAAYKIFEATMALPAVILAATFPALVRSGGDVERASDAGVRAHRRSELRLAGWLLLLGILVAGAIFALSTVIISNMFGPTFIHAVTSLRVLCLAIPLLFLNFGLTHFLIARNLERRNMTFALAMVACNIPLNLLLIPRMGGPGAAWATFGTEVALTICCVVTLRWRRWVGSPSPWRPPAAPPAAPPATT